jgi:hypothetical protein
MLFLLFCLGAHNSFSLSLAFCGYSRIWLDLSVHNKMPRTLCALSIYWFIFNAEDFVITYFLKKYFSFSGLLFSPFSEFLFAWVFLALKMSKSLLWDAFCGTVWVVPLLMGSLDSYLLHLNFQACVFLLGLWNISYLTVQVMNSGLTLNIFFSYSYIKIVGHHYILIM